VDVIAVLGADHIRPIPDEDLGKPKGERGWKTDTPFLAPFYRWRYAPFAIAFIWAFRDTRTPEQIAQAQKESDDRAAAGTVGKRRSGP
jgi:hypothetical protein